MLRILYLSKLNYGLIILQPRAGPVFSTPERTGAFCCLISLLCYVWVIKMHYSFFFQNTMGIPPSPPPISENSQSGPGEIQMHKATGEAGPVFSTQSFPVTGATTMHYPAMIDRVGLCRLGEWGGSDGVLSFGFHFILPVGKRKFFAGIGCSVSFKF